MSSSDTVDTIDVEILEDGLEGAKKLISFLRIPSWVDRGDLMSVAAITILEKGDEYDPSHPSGASFQTFMFDCLRKAFYKFMKSQYPIREESMNGNVSSKSSDGGLGVASFEHRTEIDTLCSVLSVEERIILELHYARGMNHKELGSRIGIAKNSVTQKIGRALTKVRDSNASNIRKTNGLGRNGHR